MTQFETQFHVANHWPLIERSILWRQATSHRRVLEVLAHEQADHLGAPVPLGQRRLEELLECERGESRAMMRALVTLRDDGVVTSTLGGGPSATTWSFTRDLTRWRGKVWASSQRSVKALIFGGSTSTACATAGQFPDQSVQQRDSSLNLSDCSESNHLFSRFFLEEVWRCRARCGGGNTESSGKLVELSTWHASRENALLFTGLSLSEKDSLTTQSPALEQKVSIIQGSMTRNSKNGLNAFGKTLVALAQVVDHWSIDQCEMAAQWLDEMTVARGRVDNPPVLLLKIQQMTESPAFQLAGGGRTTN